MSVPEAVDLSEFDALEDGDPDRLALERAAENLWRRGVDFTVEHGKVVPVRRETDRETVLDIGKDRVKLAIISDTHLGSKFEQLTALQAFYHYADTQKVDAFIHCGDWLQGSDRMHKGMELEVHAHGSDEQVNYAAAVYPRSKRRGVLTYGISGNHDDSFLKDGGTNVVRQLASLRSDIAYVGQDAAFLVLGALRMYLVHPDGGGAYAKSYKPQKIAEALPVERNVVLALIGHYHVFGQFRERRTHTLMLPCFQSQYAWLARKSLHPDIGGLIVDLWLDGEGNLARIRAEFVSYQRRENDWDHQSSAAVSRAWSPEAAA